MTRNIYGLDLGTYEIKIYDKKKETLWSEKNVIAIADEKDIFAIGASAYEMYEKAPENIEVVFPMKEGVISRFHDMQYLLEKLLKQERFFSRGSTYVIAVPTDVTEVEKKAFFDLVIHSSAKAKEVRIIERALADAIGSGIDIATCRGVGIINFGGSTIEVSVLSLGGMVINKMLKFGGSHLDTSIVQLVRHRHDFLIGSPTAESLRKSAGLYADESFKPMTVAGRDLLTGFPKQQDVTLAAVSDSLRTSLDHYMDEITLLFDRIPPEVIHAIRQNGIYLTGGLSNLTEMARYIESKIGFPIHTAEDPAFCTVRGLKTIIQSKEWKNLTYSMLDENYRWMR